jgi:hypothetical protein
MVRGKLLRFNEKVEKRVGNDSRANPSSVRRAVAKVAQTFSSSASGSAGPFFLALIILFTILMKKLYIEILKNTFAAFQYYYFRGGSTKDTLSLSLIVMTKSRYACLPLLVLDRFSDARCKTKAKNPIRASR